MTQDIQEHLLLLFEQVRLDPGTSPPVLLDGWQEGSAEWRLLDSFRGMVEQVQQRMLHLKQAEQQLREREEQYRSIFESVTDGILIVELKDSRLVEVNPRACEIFGRTREEFLGRVTGLSDDTQTPPVYARDVVKAGRQFQSRQLGTGKHGKSFYADVHAFPFIYKGEPHMLEIVRDITEQVQASEREEQYRSIFEASTDGLLIIDLEESRLVEVNPKACQLAGYTRDEYLGRIDGLKDDTQDPPVYARDVVRSGGLFQKRGIATSKHGKSFYAEYIASPFIYKGKTHMLQVVHDITERLQDEQELREREAQRGTVVQAPAELSLSHEEEQYRSIFEAVIDGLLIIDPKNDSVVEVNPSACQMFGYTREEFLGQVIIPNDDTQQPPVYARDVVRAGGLFQVRKRLMGKEQKTFEAEVRASPFTYKGRPHMLVVVRDISAQVQAEQQLREREEQYRSIFEAVTDGILIVDLHDRYLVEVNPRGCQMFGYTREEFLGQIIALRDNTRQPPVNARDVILAGGLFQTRDIGRSKDGKTFFIEAHASPFTYKDKPHMLAIIRDITEQVQAEKQLREREEQYRGIFEATYDALFIIDLDGFLIEVNPAFCRMFGYPYEEVIGLHASVFAAPVSLPSLAESLEALNRGRDIQTQVGQGVRKDGTVFYNEAHSTTFTYRGKPHALGVIRDITERIEAEQQLSEKEEQYRSIFESTYDAINILDLDGYFVEVNPAFCTMFGYTREELIGMHASVTTAPETLPVLDDALNTFKAGMDYQTVVARARRKDGTLFYAESHGTALTYRGEPHALSVSRDVTEQVQAQQLLEQRVEERTRELASLLSISHTVASTLQLKPLVRLILDQLKTVVDYTGASILTVEGDELVFLDSRSPTPEEQLRQIRLLPQRMGPIWETITAGQIILLPDIRDDTSLAQALREGMGGLMDTTFSYVRASLFVPLTLKDRVIGMLVLTSSEADAFTQHHATLAQAIANQAAIAIENARLYAQAQELAALEERQKLARELHDSVSQALYGISLGAHAARTALEREPGEVAEPLDYVLALAEAALAEMRALIFELRPESLETEGLVSALSKQAAATQARHELVVSTELCDEPDLPLHVKQELYRIAQEAMHNTVKHAHASQVILRLQQADGGMVLEVRDNGVGFDASASFPGHLGLHSMSERVANLGGTFEIVSSPGNGTRICVRVQGEV
jgi:PAS domain S-box-containing protein